MYDYSADINTTGILTVVSTHCVGMFINYFSLTWDENFPVDNVKIIREFSRTLKTYIVHTNTCFVIQKIFSQALLIRSKATDLTILGKKGEIEISSCRVAFSKPESRISFDYACPLHELSKIKMKIINKIATTTKDFYSEKSRILSTENKPDTWHGSCTSRGASKYVSDMEYMLEYEHECPGSLKDMLLLSGSIYMEINTEDCPADLKLPNIPPCTLFRVPQHKSGHLMLYLDKLEMRFKTFITFRSYFLETCKNVCIVHISVKYNTRIKHNIFRMLFALKWNVNQQQTTFFLMFPSHVKKVDIEQKVSHTKGPNCTGVWGFVNQNHSVDTINWKLYRHQTMSWNQAEAFCRSRGQNLPHLSSESELHSLIAHIIFRSLYRAYIGLLFVQVSINYASIV